MRGNSQESRRELIAGHFHRRRIRVGFKEHRNAIHPART